MEFKILPVNCRPLGGGNPSRLAAARRTFSCRDAAGLGTDRSRENTAKAAEARDGSTRAYCPRGSDRQATNGHA